MAATILRIGLFLFLAATLGLCRMLPFTSRYTGYPADDTDDDDNTNNLIISHQNPHSDTSNSRPQIHNIPSSSSSALTILPPTPRNLSSPLLSPSDTTTPSLELLHARRALSKLKSLLGPSTLRALLAQDIALGNAQWHTILASSSDSLSQPHRGNLKLSQVHLLARQPCTSHVNFTAPNFLAWFLTSAFTRPQNLWAGHPEHYGVHLVPNEDGTLRGEILEPWGPIMTDSYVPRFLPVGEGAPGRKKAWMSELKDYPMQMVGEETLMDGSGSVIANLHYAYRDVEADEGCEKKEGGKGAQGSGVEGVFAMWMPDGTPDEVVDGLSEHLEIEYYNWFRWAFEDLESGAFKPE